MCTHVRTSSWRTAGYAPEYIWYGSMATIHNQFSQCILQGIVLRRRRHNQKSKNGQNLTFKDGPRAEKDHICKPKLCQTMTGKIQ